MPSRFAANIATLFADIPLLDRFQAARSAGFAQVEFPQPYDWPIDLLSRRLAAAEVSLSLIDLPVADGAGQEGLACLPGEEEAFRVTVETALRYAKALKVPVIHCPAGLVPEGAKRGALRTLYLDNVAYAARRCAEDGVTVVVQPRNPDDCPAYFLDSYAGAAHALNAVRDRGGDAGLLFSIMDCARIHGDVQPWLAALAHEVSYYRIAGVPGGHEPDCGVLPFADLLRDVALLSPDVTVGLDYTPVAGTLHGLKWLEEVIPTLEPHAAR
ncbi:hydroxypyruvate isomerase [Rubricella aquisinus]|uniref:Hydroxypyruvate isomerase n=1 Tax=Rubricella aquisinus TaxID=2028108 RepID=A0A840WLY8_9RHOB|nr:TIM barrel protein [Rubricella aquisinus]MBB5515143.1 hydroxypyruvate isomerase [Rubricella aquisinus]